MLIAVGLVVTPAGLTLPSRNGLIAAQGTGGGPNNSSLWLVGASAKFVGLGFNPAWSPDGKWLAYGEPHAIEIARVQGMRLTGRRVLVRQRDRFHPVGDPAWSGDGKYVVYAQGDFGGDIYKARVSDGRTFRLTHAPRGLRYLGPAWSPDNRTIAFDACNASGSRCALDFMDADGSHVRVVLSRPGTAFIRPKWSPDGRKIGLTRDVNFREQAEILDLASHKLRSLSDESEHFDAWSPGGRRILIWVSGDFDGCTDRLAVTTESGHVVRYLSCEFVAGDWQPVS